jgi:serine kinase of HPr protein (carbohydrate metabolism regulator)
VTARHNVHATGIVLGPTGVLLRGPSGAGKSLLALALLDSFAARGEPAMLVSDDRVDIEVGDDALVMRAPEAIAGLIELRGRGIVRRPHVATAPLHLVVDLVAHTERMVEEDELATELYGVRLARCPAPMVVSGSMGHQLLLVGEAIRALSTDTGLARQNTT